MDTKRCPKCHKLLRAEAQICSLCGHNFVQVTYVRRKARTNPDPTVAMSDLSHPPASPHGAGHYSGLHPEDQPYQSSFMVAVRPTATRRLAGGWEQEGNILPEEEDDAPATPPGLPVPTQQRQVKKTVKLVASPSQSPVPQTQRGSSTSSSASSRRQPPVSPAQHRQALPPPYPPYLPLKAKSQGHAVPILLIAATILFLLATSLLAFLLLDGKSMPRQVVLAPPRLQLSTNSIDLGKQGPGGVSHKTIALSNTGEQSIVWQAIIDQSWLTITTASGKLTGNTTTSLMINVNRGTLAPGLYTGHIAFTSRGSHQPLATLAVSMEVNSSPVSLVLSLASLSYYGSATQNPAGQTITIANKGMGPLAWSAAVSSGNSTPWLSISPTHGHLAANASQIMTVNVHSQGLVPGTYQGTVNFKGGANPQLTVTLTIASSGNLSVSPSSLAFSAVAGQQATNQGLVVQNGGGQPLNWTAVATTSNGGNWLSATPSGGYLDAQVAANITVNASAAGLSAGTYQGTLSFSYGGAPSMQVAVSFTVSPVPVAGIGIQPTALNFSTIMGKNPQPQSFLITNTGTAPLDWAISEDANGTKYIPLASTHSTLAPGKSTSVSVAPTVSKAGAGTIAAVLTILDSDKGSQVPQRQITVTIAILNQAQISNSVSNMSFDQSSQITQSTELLVITNTGSAVLNWALAQSGQSQAPWLSMDNTLGSLGPSEAALVNITCDSSQLSPGTYTATLQVSDTDSGTPVQPQYITVTLTVSS
ncbi:MAG TPA: choice-of-anchor D domain-containing protein [Ktedonobacteraceae bacterium]